MYIMLLMHIINSKIIRCQSPQQDNVKYLGIYLDKKVNWANQVKTKVNL